MSGIEKTEIKNKIQGMTEEQKRFALMMFPPDMLHEEIARRDREQRKMLRDVRRVVRVTGDFEEEEVRNED